MPPGPQNTNSPLFGIGIYPSVKGWDVSLALARYSDGIGLDLVSVQDHPYNPEFLDTWTLLSVTGALTGRIRLMTDVSPVSLRPPAMLAKAAGTLDILTGGRVDLGLGTGAFWDAIAGYGGPRREPGEAVSALEEAVQVIRALLQNTGAGPVDFPGKYYRLQGAMPGPPPAHPIRIWIGALRPRLLRVTGRLADGLIISSPRVPPEQVSAMNALVDEGAQQASRDPAVVRRGYNLGGVIVTQANAGLNMRPSRPGVIVGPPAFWVDEIVRYYRDLRMDTFLYMPSGPDSDLQARAFAEEVVPAAREALGARGRTSGG